MHAAAEVVEHQQEEAGADRELEHDVEVISPRRPGTLRAEEGIVEVMDAPEEKRRRQEQRP